MKIVLCCRVYATHNRPGGMIHVVQERAEQLARFGHEVHVLTTQRAGKPYNTAELVNGVKVWQSSGIPQQYSDDYSESCIEWCKSIHPDILHLDSWDKNRLWWHDRPGDPEIVAVTNHGEGIGSQLTDWRMHLHNRPLQPSGESNQGRSGALVDPAEWVAERKCLLPADAVITTCRFDRWMLSDLLALGSKVKLVYNPLAPYHFLGRIPPPQQRKFLCVGVWGHSERGFDLAWEACQGCGFEMVKPRDVPRRDLVKFYDECSALLLPGFQSKGYDLSVAEALARLRPVIYSDSGVATMEAIDQPWIVTIPAGDLGALSDKLRSRKLPQVPTMATDKHKPENHVRAWLTALGVEEGLHDLIRDN